MLSRWAVIDRSTARGHRRSVVTRVRPRPSDTDDHPTGTLDDTGMVLTVAGVEVSCTPADVVAAPKRGLGRPHVREGPERRRFTGRGRDMGWRRDQCCAATAAAHTKISSARWRAALTTASGSASRASTGRKPSSQSLLAVNHGASSQELRSSPRAAVTPVTAG